MFSIKLYIKFLITQNREHKRSSSFQICLSIPFSNTRNAEKARILYNRFPLFLNQFQATLVSRTYSLWFQNFLHIIGQNRKSNIVEDISICLRIVSFTISNINHRTIHFFFVWKKLDFFRTNASFLYLT